MNYGIIVKEGQGGKRLEIQCKHQSGVLYVVPSEASWVCSQELLHAHALAGFMRELIGLQDARVEQALRRWGLYFRERPLAENPDVQTSKETG